MRVGWMCRCCLAVVVMVAFSSLPLKGQELFNHDFENSFPDYGYNYAFAGEGLSDCSPGPDGDVSATSDISTGPEATATLDTSNWMVAPDACYDFAGWGLGMGHILGFEDPPGSGMTTYEQQFTSTDLADYTLQFDAWIAGTDPFIDMQFQVQFQGPEIDPGTGFPVNSLIVGVDGSNGLPPLLDTFPQTFTFAMDTLPILSGEPAALLGITQVQLQLQPQGSSASIGFDNDNMLFVDNVSLTAPHDVIEPVSCDLDDSGVCDTTDADLMVADIVDGTDLYDLTGDGMSSYDDLVEWLALAGAENLLTGNSYLIGDANLDGIVDGLDFIDWNDNKFTNLAAWSGGDFNADGVVDGLDFIEWNNNKFMSADTAIVPEPSSLALLLVAFGLLGIRRRG